MTQLARPAALRLPRRTLRARLALLYAAVFCSSAAALAAVAVIFKPNFLVGTSCTPAPGTPGGQGSCGQHAGLSFTGTITRHLQQNAGGVAMLVIMVILAGGVGWLIAGRVLRPLRTITSTAREISATNLHQRLAVTGPDDEFRQLGETLDGLFGRLETSFQAQRHFVANASHELRTPLTAGKTVLQVALADPGATAATLRSACEKALHWTEQQERLIDGLLTLASSERGIERWEPFDLATVARAAIAQYASDAERERITVTADLSPAPATGDPTLAMSLLANLVSNAIRHNHTGGQVSIATSAPAGHATVRIGNTGPLVPPAEVDRLFQPFQRLGPQRLSHTGGHGLGLAISRAIVSAHGAELTAAARPGGGLGITLTFRPVSR